MAIKKKYSIAIVDIGKIDEINKIVMLMTLVWILLSSNWNVKVKQILTEH